MEDGYYWATQKSTGERQVVNVMGDTVFQTGNDMGFELDEFTDYVEAQEKGESNHAA